MVSLKGYESLNHSAFSLLSSLHSAISAVKTDGANQPALNAELAKYSALTGRFYTDLLTLLVQAVDRSSELESVGLAPHWITQRIGRGLEIFTNQICTVDFIRHIRSNAINVSHFWQMEDGSLTEAESRKVQWDLFKRYKGTSLALSGSDEQFKPCLIYAKHRKFDDGSARECMALNIGELLDAIPSTKTRAVLPNPLVLSGEAARIVVSAELLIGSLLDLHEFRALAGKHLLFDDFREKIEGRPKKPEPKIRVTDNLKYPIGLFG